MNQDNGGIIGKLNTPTTTVASGVWTLQDQFEAQTSSIWPLAFPQTTIANSLRFDDGSSDYLNITQSAGNRQIFTYSLWVKRSTLGNRQRLIRDYNGASAIFQIYFESSNDTLFVLDYTDTNPNPIQIRTNQVFRDPSAWYHIVVSIDTTQATSSNRVKIYINGSQVTSFAEENYPSQNFNSSGNQSGNTLYIGSTGSGDYFDGYMTEVIFVDGQQLLPTSFGVFNTVSNIWEPRGYVGTYGTNGFRLDFANSSALGNDVSGNDNDFTVNNLTSIDQATDTCSNNFCTMNPLEYTGATYGTGTLSEGNCKVTIADNNTNVANFTLNQGKWYWEQKHISSASSQNRIEFGIIQQDVPDYIGGDSAPNQSGKGLIWAGFGDLRGYISTSSFGTFAPNDIIGCALDMDAQTLQFYKNGSAVSTAQDFSGAGWTNVAPTVFCSNNAGNEVGEINFGNPTFSISSGNADANGHGNFEYAVPSGYFSLCTKNLAEFG
jgi:hypothetical protein